MFNKLFKFFIYCIMSWILVLPGWGKPVLTNLPSQQLLERFYYKHLKKFTQQMCSHGEEQQFDKLYNAYRGKGEYVPLIGDRIDRVAIKRNIPFLKEKVKWIKHNIEKLKHLKNFQLQKQYLKEVRRAIHKLLTFKKEYYTCKNAKQKQLIKQRSRHAIKEFKTLYVKFLDSIFFLKTFHFPVDFFQLRKFYDQIKSGELNKKISKNQLYFFRKIVEDGAQNQEHKKSDRFLRTSLSSVYLLLMRHHTIISEDLRYDLMDTSKNIEDHLQNGVASAIFRQQEWLTRVEHQISFYRHILQLSAVREKKFLKHKKGNQKKLEHFVKQMQEKTYRFWMRRKDYLQAIFALETILMNEVGDVDGPDGLERRDVAQVVINRWYKHWYGYLGRKDFLFDVKTNPKTRKKLAKYRWLNVLFKTGEFSFTYYFIHSTVRIFCPDMSPRGKKLRAQNVHIAIDALKHDRRKQFKAERYFSRASMVGRVDMTSIWKNFSAYPERPGRLIKDSKKLKKLYDQDKYEYYYFFSDPWGRYFNVVEINGTPYVVSFNGRDFYTYRNRHYFKYFIPIDN